MEQGVRAAMSGAESRREQDYRGERGVRLLAEEMGNEELGNEMLAMLSAANLAGGASTEGGVEEVQRLIQGYTGLDPEESNIMFNVRGGDNDEPVSLTDILASGADLQDYIPIVPEGQSGMDFQRFYQQNILNRQDEIQRERERLNSLLNVYLGNY
jgi:hypothetical protein